MRLDAADRDNPEVRVSQESIDVKSRIQLTNTRHIEPIVIAGDQPPLVLGDRDRP